MTDSKDPAGIMDLFGVANTFLDTLHEVLHDGAEDVRKQGDKQGAEDVEMFEYNWLSLFGYSKGILPLITDFYLYYFREETFTRNNGAFVRDMRKLILLFTTDGSIEEMYTALETLIGGSIRQNLFNDGAIKTFLHEFQNIINNQPACFELLRRAKSKAKEISQFLHFVLKGAPKRDENKPPVNSEL